MSRLRVNPDDAARAAFRQEVKVKRAYLDMSQSALATELNIGPSSMSLLLSDPDKISVGRLRAMNKALGLDPAVLLALIGCKQQKKGSDYAL